MFVIKEIRSVDEKLDKFTSKEWPIADMEHYGREVDFNKRTLKFKAEDSCGEIMGLIEIIIEADLAKIETLLVGHNFRRKGVGKALMEKALNISIDEGCKKIWLETNAGWEAEKFYKSIGYKVEARLKKHILGQDSLILVKFL